MRRTLKELTDIEIIDTFFEIVDMICESYNHPVRGDFQKASRAAQIGYDIQRTLLDKQIIETGSKYNQEKLKV